MSKLINAMRLKETGNRVACLGDMEISVKEHITEAPKLYAECFLEYRLGIEIGLSFVGPSEEVSYRKSHAERMIREEIFGEYRNLLYRIHNAAYNRDFSEVSKLATQIEESMFND